MNEITVGHAPHRGAIRELAREVAEIRRHNLCQVHIARKEVKRQRAPRSTHQIAVPELLERQRQRLECSLRK